MITQIRQLLFDLAFIVLVVYLVTNYWPAMVERIDHVYDQVNRPESTIDADLVFIENLDN